jgi:hypothetical protein
MHVQYSLLVLLYSCERTCEESKAGSQLYTLSFPGRIVPLQLVAVNYEGTACLLSSHTA